MEKSLFKPFLIVVILMTVSVFALAFTVGVELDFVPGVKMELPEEVQNWHGNQLKFCHNPEECAKDYRDASFYVSELEIPDICPVCGSRLYNMARAEKEQLPEDTEFVKSAYTNEAGTRLFTSIVLSGTARDSIHRPQRCLKGQGNTLDGEYDLEVPMEGRDPLKVRVIKTSRTFRTEEGEQPYYSFYAYWFVGQDRETPSHYSRMFWLAWDRVVRSTANRWAYIAVQGEREAEGTEYEGEIISFVQEIYPQILTETMRKKAYGD
ncbi:exosortase-associated EpsI family protein [Pontiella agarivorans]|uniref:Exosortase-associated EpsI family protein n=1 Tax=Pontiella agarivorans TaxID=3038953 RepID=A0ABU5MTD6_9BACT|nr:exosortase-associated EpsI family protein [Pontiella agarivorans]MDZ8117397.1 exosortase-associated EpsI family protein [Pontiella agarivorans]